LICRFEKSVLRHRETEYSLESIYEMLDMTEILTLRTGIENQLKRIVTTASKVMDAERASLFLADDAARAVTTALEMQMLLRKFNQDREARGDIPIKIGTGICTGDVVSGNIGSERRMDFTVIGDGVNVASRIEKLTKYYGVDILIGESTLAELEDGFCTRLIDRVRAKGKKRPVRIYEVLGGRETTLSTGQKLFDEGFAFYRKMDFEKAAERFERGLESDPVCRVFLDRCRHLLSRPPEADWDGVWVSQE